MRLKACNAITRNTINTILNHHNESYANQFPQHVSRHGLPPFILILVRNLSSEMIISVLSEIWPNNKAMMNVNLF